MNRGSNFSCKPQPEKMRTYPTPHPEFLIVVKIEVNFINIYTYIFIIFDFLCFGTYATDEVTSWNVHISYLHFSYLFNIGNFVFCQI